MFIGIIYLSQDTNHTKTSIISQKIVCIKKVMHEIEKDKKLERKS